MSPSYLSVPRNTSFADLVPLQDMLADLRIQVDTLSTLSGGHWSTRELQALRCAELAWKMCDAVLPWLPESAVEHISYSGTTWADSLNAFRAYVKDASPALRVCSSLLHGQARSRTQSRAGEGLLTDAFITTPVNDSSGAQMFFSHRGDMYPAQETLENCHFFWRNFFVDNRLMSLASRPV